MVSVKQYSVYIYTHIDICPSASLLPSSGVTGNEPMPITNYTQVYLHAYKYKRLRNIKYITTKPQLMKLTFIKNENVLCSIM